MITFLANALSLSIHLFILIHNILCIRAGQKAVGSRSSSLSGSDGEESLTELRRARQAIKDKLAKLPAYGLVHPVSEHTSISSEVVWILQSADPCNIIFQEIHASLTRILINRLLNVHHIYYLFVYLEEWRPCCSLL